MKINNHNKCYSEKEKHISRKEAIEIAMNILYKAEAARKEVAEEEASRGIQYNEKDDK